MSGPLFLHLATQFFVARQFAKRWCYTHNFVCNLSRNGVALQVAEKLTRVTDPLLFDIFSLGFWPLIRSKHVLVQEVANRK